MAGRQKLGIVTSGSLDGGVEIKLDSKVSVEEMAVGRYVTIEGQRRRFFGLITDIALQMTDPAIAMAPPAGDDPFTAEVLNGTSTYGTLHVAPQLTIGGDAESITEGPQPVKTIPSHFAPVNLASEADIELVFGKEDARRFWIGNPLDMETRLCLDLEEFVKRSNGIFGKSGTGKTFLTRILLAGMLQKSKAVNLVFDMQNEYGWAGFSEGQKSVKGLKQLFASKVAIFTLDKENSLHRKVSADFEVQIGYEEIEPEDIELLRQTVNFTEAAVAAVYQLKRKFKNNWLARTLNMTDEDTDIAVNELKIHEATLQNLQRGLSAIANLGFIKEHTPVKTVQNLLEYLDRGMNVILEFGRYQSLMAYILVANMISRRIYKQYRSRAEKALDESAKPVPLVITIEEAHKFLGPGIGEQTIFGEIAREMRKYNVTLLVIDQRPSGIDSEVMSQLGTKITCLLDSEEDVDSVLAGVSGKSELRKVLAKLSAKQQALIFGHAVPMPVAFRPRDYGTAESYAAFQDKGSGPDLSNKDIEDLWK